MINKKINKAQRYILGLFLEGNNNSISQKQVYDKFLIEFPELNFDDYFNDLQYTGLIRLSGHMGYYEVSNTDKSPIYYLPISTIAIIEEYDMIVNANLSLPKQANDIAKEANQISRESNKLSENAKFLSKLALCISGAVLILELIKFFFSLYSK